MKYLNFCFTIIFVFIYGCSSTKEVKKAEEKSSLKDLITYINNQSSRIKSITADGNINIESTREANSGSFDLVLRKTDSIGIKIKGPFGINAARVSVTKDTFRFFNALENFLVIGQTSEKSFSEILNVSMSFRDIMAILSCTPDFLREESFFSPKDSIIDNGELIISYQKDDMTVKYWVNSEQKYITKRCMFSSRGKVLREERYQNYIKLDNYWLPKSIQVILHAEKQSLTLYYSNHKINPAFQDFSFSAPDGIRTIQWR